LLGRGAGPFARGDGTVAKHSPTLPKVQGLSPATVAGTGREKGVQKIVYGTDFVHFR
jgi:hypothetical protein